MKIASNCVATINYQLKDDAGAVVDSSDDGGPIVMLVGAEDIIPGLEKALLGQEAGAKVSVSVPPEEAYGARNDELVDKVPRENFPGIDNIEAGMMFQTQMEDGQAMVVTIVEADEVFVTVDGNHPMAGKTLHFDLEVVDVRAATEEEIAHGHVHAGDSCGHDH